MLTLRPLTRVIAFGIFCLTISCMTSDPIPLFDVDGDGAIDGIDCTPNDPSIGARYPDQDGDGYGDIAGSWDGRL